MQEIKVIVIDDSAVVRQSISGILEKEKGIRIVGTAPDPIIGRERIKALQPDVVILDIEMPKMDGLTFLQEIMSTNPIPVIICSSQAESNSMNAIKALEYGAVDIINKPKIGTKIFIEESRTIFSDAIQAASQVKPRRYTAPSEFKVEKKLNADVILAAPGTGHTIETTEKVIAIGASTGGTEALKEILIRLEPDVPGIVVVQHMPEMFTRAFAKRLDGLCRVTVKEAEDNDAILRGRVLIAPGNKHTLVKRAGAKYLVEVKDGPLVSRHRPSVDVLFRSAARYAGENAVGIIMTGMGDDGANGLREMMDCGAFTIAQDEKSCAVFGMPKEAIARGGVRKIVSLLDIPWEIERIRKTL